MTGLKSRIDEAVAAVRKRTAHRPETAIILGTGLGGLSREIKRESSVPYEEIPHFARTTVVSHKGELVFGSLGGRPVVAMEGRFHLYEGYTPEQVTMPVRVARALGAKFLVVSCACGGLSPAYARGDLVLIEDHINLMGVNPLVGPNDDSLGPRFPDMSQPYDRELLALAERTAGELKVAVRRGVYAAMVGPSLETRAEYRMLQRLGADMIGMSTVPEVIAGVHAGLRMLGVAIVTDLCLPETLEPANVEDIIATAKAAEPRLTALLARVVAALRE